jgi:uncharacterized membrane protein
MEKQPQKKTRNILLALLAALAALGISINWLQHTPGGCYQKGMAIGSSVCHQISSHSFTLEDVQFPLCARCSGLYLGCFIALLYYATQGKKSGLPKRVYLLILLVLAVAWGLDGVNSFISDFVEGPFLWTTSNTSRLITGFGMGLGLSTALMTLFNLTVWKDRSKVPLLYHFGQLGVYALAAGATGFLLISENMAVFKLLAGIVVATILVVITLLYTIFWVIITRKDNTFENLRALIPFLLAGFASAMLQITLMTSLRGWLLS